MPELERSKVERKGPPPIPPEALKPKIEKETPTLRELIEERVQMLERESAPEFLESEAESAIAETAKSLDLKDEDIALAKKNVGYGEQKSSIFDKIREIGKSAVLNLKSRLSSPEAAPQVVERESVKEEVKLLEEESRNLELTNKKIVGMELAKLKEAKEKGQISAKEYKQKRAELAESRKFQYLVRMEQAIRDAEAFILQNPDSSKEEIVKAITETPERKTKLNAVQKKAIERAVEKYKEERQTLLDYVKNLADVKGIKNLPPNPLDILELNPYIKKQLLKDAGFEEDDFSIKDVIIRTDFPVAIKIEVKSAKKLLDYFNKMTDGYYSKVGTDPRDIGGVFLAAETSQKQKEGTAPSKQIKQKAGLKNMIAILNAEAKEGVESVATHELQHSIFSKLIAPARKRLRKEIKSDLESSMEENAINELTAYLKQGLYATGAQALFGRRFVNEFQNLPLEHPLTKSFQEVTDEMRRLEGSGIDPKMLFTVAETSENLDEFAKRLRLVPGKLEAKNIEKMLDKDINTGFPNTTRWLLGKVKPEAIPLTPSIINKMEKVLVLKNEYYLKNPNENGLLVIKADAKQYKEITGKESAEMNSVIKKVEEFLSA